MASLSSSDLLGRNFKAGKQTFIIPLTFPDLNAAKSLLTRVGYGGDIWEVRVDLLSPKTPLEAINLPSAEYVQSQIKLLKSLSDLPILFTIRTASQGGKCPDDAADEALALMLMAVSEGCQYIDVEIEWPSSLLQAITERKGQSQVVASFHDWTGNIRWTSKILNEKFKLADAFGDIIKLSILSADLNDCHELALFVRNYRLAGSSKPLLAVGMGANGQLSRIISPISLVTHPLIPFPSAPGQLSLAQVHQALHLIGQLPKREFQIFGDDENASRATRGLNAAFAELGYPYVAKAQQIKQHDDKIATGNDFLIPTSLNETQLSEMICKKFIEWTGRVAPASVIDNAVRA